MMPFGGGSGRVGRSRMRLDEMDCADIMMKAVQRKRSRSIARRESFSGTEDDLKKFRDAVEANEKEDLQKDIDEYAVKVRELRGDNIDKNSSAEFKKDSNDIYLDKSPFKENGVEITSTNLEKDTAIVSKQNDKTKFEENESVNTENNKVISKTNNNQVKSDPSSGSGEEATEDPNKQNEYLQISADNTVEPNIVRDGIAQENKDSTNTSSNQQEQNVNENESFISEETPSYKAVFDEKGKSNIADENNVDVPNQIPKEDTENYDNEYIPLNHPIIKSSHITESKNNAENSNADETNDNDRGIEKEIEDKEIQNVQNIEHPIDVNENILIEDVNESKIINNTTEKKDTDETNKIVKEIKHDIKDKETQNAHNTEHTNIVNESNLIDNVNESKITNITTEREETDKITENTKSNDKMLDINENYPKDANESKITKTSEREETDIVTENTKSNDNLVPIEMNDNDPENVTVPDNGESLCPDSEINVYNNNDNNSINHIDQENDTPTDSIANEISNGPQVMEKHELAPEKQKVETQNENENGSSDLLTKPSKSTKQSKCEDIATSQNGTTNESGEKDPNFLSIVDRIKSDITTLKTLSKQGTKTSVNIDYDLAQKEGLTGNSIDDHDHGIEKTETLNNHSGDHKQSGLKVALDRVCREKSASHIQIPKELSSHLINLSSANISEQLKRSCSNIVAHTMEQELSKEFLLKKLEELLKEERKQVVEDLKRRREQLQDVKSAHTEEINSLKQRQNNDIRNLHGKHSIEFDNIENNYLDHIEQLRKEIEFFENEKQNMKSPNQLITDCLSGTIRLETSRYFQ